VFIKHWEPHLKDEWDKYPNVEYYFFKYIVSDNSSLHTTIFLLQITYCAVSETMCPCESFTVCECNKVFLGTIMW